jgi:hypothetical protein
MPNKEEIQILKQARLFRDMVATEAWLEYVKVLEAQIAAREEVLHIPLHSLPPHFVPPSTDLSSKAAAIESVKGAIIGLRTALNTPTATIESAREIAKTSKDDANAA